MTEWRCLKRRNMTKDRTINASFLLSLGVHAAVFLLFSFVIVVDFGSVASFIEVTYVGYAGKDTFPAGAVPMKLKMHPSINLPDRTFAAESIASNAGAETSPLSAVEEKVGLTRDYSRGKPNPGMFDVLKPPGRTAAAVSLALHEKYSVEGELSFRKIILKPPSPKYPEWAVNSGVEANVKLRVMVNPQGIVESVESVQSTSYLKVDLVASEYIKQWRFEGKALETESESGIVSIKFRLK